MLQLKIGGLDIDVSPFPFVSGIFRPLLNAVFCYHSSDSEGDTESGNATVKPYLPGMATADPQTTILTLIFPVPPCLKTAVLKADPNLIRKKFGKW